MLLEGPYGSVGVDIDSDHYKMVMLISGGIGVTPMQALCNQLMYEQSTGLRDLKKLSFVWMERDPSAMNKVDVVRRTHDNVSKASPKEDVQYALRGLSHGVSSRSLATTLLAMVPPSNVSNMDFENEYACTWADEDEDDEDSVLALSRMQSQRSVLSTDDHDTICQSLLDVAYCGAKDGIDANAANNGILDLQVFLTARTEVTDAMVEMPFVQYGRPDLPTIFRKMREDAIAKKECRVAVCICAPETLVRIVKNACMDFSDEKVHFDLHNEIFG